MVQQVADRVREEEAARVKEEAAKAKEEQEYRCKNAKNKCVDKPCQEKAIEKILPHIESKKELQNKL